MLTVGIAGNGRAQSRIDLEAVLVSGVDAGRLRDQVFRSKFGRLLRFVGVGAFVLLGFCNVLFIDPVLFLRTTVLAALLGFLLGHSLFDTGVPGISPKIRAHSVLLDGSVFCGLVMPVLSMSAITISLVTTYRSIPRTVAYSFPLVIYVIVVVFTESIHSWNYWSVCIVAVTSAILMAGSIQRKAE